MLTLTTKGLYCRAGDFYIDPTRVVQNAVITHAHSDHARKGSKRYYCVTSGVSLLKARLGQHIAVDAYGYGESFYFNDVKISFHGAGHILGASQVRIEYLSEVWVVSGDYKREPDPTCEPFESVPCDVFITEATFGTYRTAFASGWVRTRSNSFDKNFLMSDHADWDDLLLSIKILRQRRGMAFAEVHDILQQLKDRTRAHFLFAVQGGIFSEGVDYPGDMAIGVFIVGPPLPNFDLERESMKRYYEEKFSQGFDYAYTYPAMAKAIQAAGRLIRSETDTGIIILMDNRFLQTSFVNCMPKDWFNENIKENVSARILQDITDFWEQVRVETKSLASALADCPD